MFFLIREIFFGIREISGKNQGILYQMIGRNPDNVKKTSNLCFLTPVQKLQHFNIGPKISLNKLNAEFPLNCDVFLLLYSSLVICFEGLYSYVKKKYYIINALIV